MREYIQLNDLAPIVVTTYNRKNHLKNMITSLKKNNLSKDSEIYIFCDNYKSEIDKKLVQETINYAKEEAFQQFKSGKKVGWFGILIKPVMRFIYSYFRTGAFIRGVPGLLYSMLNLIYDFNVNIILWELCHDLNRQGGIKKSSLVRGKLIKNSTKAKK